MLKVIDYNIKNGQKNYKAFEIGNIYQKDFKEKEVIGLMITGEKKEHWSIKRKRASKFL